MSIPTGTYEAIAVEANLFESSQKGTPYVAVTFRVVDGDYAGQHIQGRFFFGDRLDRGGKTLTDRTKEIMASCGLGTENFDPASGSFRLPDPPESVAIVTQEDENGQPRVRFVNRIGEAIGGQPITGAKAIGILRDLGLSSPAPSNQNRSTPNPPATQRAPQAQAGGGGRAWGR